MPSEGIIKHWNYDRGYGFAEVGEFPHDYDIFVHVSSCGDYEPSKCDVIWFEVGTGKGGRPCAVNVEFAGKRVESAYFDNHVSRRKYNEARKTHLKLERGCTCKEDSQRYGDDWVGMCWYCREKMSD